MPKPLPQRDPLSPLARDVLVLFADALAEVRFPDVDLARLNAAADELRTLQLAAEQLELELEAARAQMAARGEALTQQAQRALAYARIFAESDAALAVRVAAIEPPGQVPVARTTETKKRGRPRKSEPDSNLFGASEESALGESALQ